jgi:hypothetical protein
MAYPPVNPPKGLLERLVLATYGEERRGEWSERIRGEEREMADRIVRMAELMVAGTPPHDPAVLDEVEWYHRAANQYGVVDAAMFTALGGALVENDQSRAVFDDVVEGLATYQREAMAVYAQERLAMGGA